MDPTRLLGADELNWVLLRIVVAQRDASHRARSSGGAPYASAVGNSKSSVMIVGPPGFSPLLWLRRSVYTCIAFAGLRTSHRGIGKACGVRPRL